MPHESTNQMIQQLDQLNSAPLESPKCVITSVEDVRTHLKTTLPMLSQLNEIKHQIIAAGFKYVIVYYSQYRWASINIPALRGVH